MPKRFEYEARDIFSLGTGVRGLARVLAFKHNGSWFDGSGDEVTNDAANRTGVRVEVIRELFPELEFVEVPKKPESPVRARSENTHAVVHKLTGLQVGEGTEQQCEDYVCTLVDDRYHVVQLVD